MKHLCKFAFLAILLCACTKNSEELFDDTPDTPINKDENQYPKAELIDMGLDVLWAKWNMGECSEFNAIQSFGWGDITGNEDYTSLDNFPSPFPPECISGTEYDIATIKWGEGWRLPNTEDFSELWSNSEVSIGEHGGSTYYKFKSKINGNVIHLPLGDTFFETCYWTGVLDSKDTRRAISISFDEASIKYSWPYLYRNDKANIRPIFEHKRVETLDATEIKARNVILNGEISYLASQHAEEVGFYYSESLVEVTTPNENTKKNPAVVNNQHISANINSLIRNTNYYFRSYVVLNGQTYLGNIKEFITLNAYEVGELYPNSTNPIGVVFKINQNGTTGKIVSLDQTTLEWQAGIPTYVGANNIDDGSKNEFPPNSPIPDWVKRHGTDWYCPAKNELHTLCSAVGLVNNTLRANGKTPIENFYWASTQYSASYYDLAWIVNVTENDTYMGYYAGWTSYNSKSQKRGVVAIRKF